MTWCPACHQPCGELGHLSGACDPPCPGCPRCINVHVHERGCEAWECAKGTFDPGEGTVSGFIRKAIAEGKPDKNNEIRVSVEWLTSMAIEVEDLEARCIKEVAKHD